MIEERVDVLDRLYRDVGPLVWRYLRHRVNDEGLAEELLQETFVIVARDYDGLLSAKSQRAWLIGIARNLLREHRRLAARKHPVSVTEEVWATTEPDEDPRIDAMRSAMKRLPQTQQEVLELRLSGGLKYAEIAEALGVPIGTVRSRMHAAVGALRAWADEVGAREVLDK